MYRRVQKDAVYEREISIKRTYNEIIFLSQIIFNWLREIFIGKYLEIPKKNIIFAATYGEYKAIVNIKDGVVKG